MLKTATPCFFARSAPYFVCRSIPVALEDQTAPGAPTPPCPEVFVQYPLVSSFPQDFLQSCTTTEVEPVFQLSPQCSLRVDYEAKDLRCFSCHVLLPEQPTGTITFFTSEFFSLEFGEADLSHVYLVRGNNVAKMKTNVEIESIQGDSSRIPLPVDPKKFVTIRYGVMEDKKVSVTINMWQVNVNLENAIPSLPEHLKSVSLVNQPSDPTSTSRIGVLGIFLYGFSSPESWKSVPSDASILSTIGCHFGREEGVRKIISSNAQPRLVLKNGEGSYLDSWRSFFLVDQRACDKSCLASRNQFIYSNEGFFFNFNVQFDYENRSLLLGNDSKFGCLYLKHALPLPMFQVEMDVDLTMPDSNLILWFSSATVPSYVYLSHIQRDFINLFSGNNSQFSNCYYTNMQMDQPVMLVILHRTSEGTSLFFARSYFDTDCRKYYVFLLRSNSTEMATSGTLTCDISDCFMGFQFGSIDISVQSFNIRQYFASDVLLSGVMGSHVAISSYIANSSFPKLDYSILTNTRNASLSSWELTSYMLKQSSLFTVVPCEMSYRDFPLHANKDPAKRNPPTYKTPGCIITRANESELESFAISQDPNRDTLLLFHFCNEDSEFDYIWMNDKGVTMPLKLILESCKSNGAFALNTRLSSSHCLSCGLFNFFNICFQNSTLQLLFHSDSLKLMIADLYKSCAEVEQVRQTDDFRVLQAMMESFTRLQFSWYNTEFNNTMLTLKDRFEIGVQHVTSCCSH